MLCYAMLFDCCRSRCLENARHRTVNDRFLSLNATPNCFPILSIHRFNSIQFDSIHPPSPPFVLRFRDCIHPSTCSSTQLNSTATQPQLHSALRYTFILVLFHSIPVFPWSSIFKSDRKTPPWCNATYLLYKAIGTRLASCRERVDCYIRRGHAC